MMKRKWAADRCKPPPPCNSTKPPKSKQANIMNQDRSCVLLIKLRIQRILILLMAAFGWESQAYCRLTYGVCKNRNQCNWTNCLLEMLWLACILQKVKLAVSEESKYRSNYIANPLCNAESKGQTYILFLNFLEIDKCKRIWYVSNCRKKNK